jgi:hypothetical protein
LIVNPIFVISKLNLDRNRNADAKEGTDIKH